jgi:hypothetical protein
MDVGLKLLSALSGLATLVFAANAPVREVVTECPEIGGQPICQVRNGWTFKFDTMSNRTPRVFGPDGHFKFPLPIILPGTEIVYASDVGADSDGSFVVAATGGKADMRHWERSALVLFDAGGFQISMIDTGRFFPGHIAIAPDHSIWATGMQWDESLSKDDTDYFVLRNYSRNGRLLGSYLSRSTFPPGLPPGNPGALTALMIAGDRIGIVASSGQIGSLREVIQLDLNGNVLGRMRFDYQPGPILYAMTSTGGFFGGSNHSLLKFDPVKGTTLELSKPDTQYALIAADGPNLIYRTVTPDRHLKLVWLPAPASSN